MRNDNIGIENTAETLYVGDLSLSVNEEQLEFLFKSVGYVCSVFISRDQNTGQSLGFGYVSYTNETDAKNARNSLNYTLLCGKEIRIMPYQSDKSLLQSGLGNLCVKNLDKEVGNRALKQMFDEYGTVLSSKVMYDQNGKHLGYAFVQFDNEESALMALKGLDGKVYKGKIVKVHHYIPKSQRPALGKFTNLYIKHFPRETTQEELYEKFSCFGEITSFFFPLTEDGWPKGFAFVNFADSQSAKKAVEALHEKQPGNLYVAKAESKITRKEKLRKKFGSFEEKEMTVGKCVYLRNLPDNCTESDLIDRFAFFGEIQSVNIQRRESGGVKFLGYIIFKSRESVWPAIESTNGMEWNGKKVFAAMWVPKNLRMEWKRKNAIQKNLQRLSGDAEVVNGQFLADRNPANQESALVPNSRQFYFPIVTQNQQIAFPSKMAMEYNTAENIYRDNEQDNNSDIRLEVTKKIMDSEGFNWCKISEHILNQDIGYLKRLLAEPELMAQAITQVKESLNLNFFDERYTEGYILQGNDFNRTQPRNFLGCYQGGEEHENGFLNDFEEGVESLSRKCGVFSGNMNSVDESWDLSGGI